MEHYRREISNKCCCSRDSYFLTTMCLVVMLIDTLNAILLSICSPLSIAYMIITPNPNILRVITPLVVGIGYYILIGYRCYNRYSKGTPINFTVLILVLKDVEEFEYANLICKKERIQKIEEDNPTIEIV